jgi:1,2-diacylglycerol 3-alpha-glucosyltransferase
VEDTHYVVPGSFDKAARSAVRKLSAQVLHRADRVIAPTKKTENLLLSYGVKTPIDVVPTGVDLNRFSPVDPGNRDEEARLTALKNELGIGDFKHVLLVLGRMAPEKSVLELLLEFSDWLKTRPDACILMVGGGPQLKELKSLTQKLGLESQVVFTGEQPWESMPDYYRIGDILIGNSTTETQGLTFIEALASGTPIVVRRNSCFDGIISDGISGTLLDSSEGFVSAVEELFDKNFRAERIAGGLQAAQAVSKEAFAAAIEHSYLLALAEAKFR